MTVKPKILKALPITALWLIAQITSIRAATYYFSSSQGNDTNAGTSVDAPWKGLSKVYFKSISSTNFSPGDSILLKAGDTFEDTISLYTAGTQAAPIRIGKYGIGANPIIYGDSPDVTWSAVGGYPGIYSATPTLVSTIVRVADTNGNNYTKINQGTNTLGVWLSQFGTNNWGFTFDTPTLIYIRTADSSPPPQMHLFQYSGVLFEKDYITVENLDIRRCVSGIVANHSRGFVVRNNSIQDTTSIGIYFGLGCSHGEVASNTVSRAGYTMMYFQTGGNNWAHHNTLSVCSRYVLGLDISGPERGGIGLERGTNNVVEYNTISYVDHSFFDYWAEVGTVVRYNYGFHGSGAYPTGDGLRVHNNVFNCDDAGAGLGGYNGHDLVNNPVPYAGTNYIYNNVIYGSTTYGLHSASMTSTGICVRNNIFVTTSTNYNLLQVNSGIDSDYNLFYCTTGAPRGWYWNNVNCTTLAAFKAGSGQDTHSLYANPQFVSANPVTAADFQLKRTSPCIDAGQDLKVAGLLPPAQEYKDYLGTLIPQDAGPDIGAYEKTFSSVAPPTNLHVEKP